MQNKPHRFPQERREYKTERVNREPRWPWLPIRRKMGDFCSIFHKAYSGPTHWEKWPGSFGNPFKMSVLQIFPIPSMTCLAIFLVVRYIRLEHSYSFVQRKNMFKREKKMLPAPDLKKPPNKTWIKMLLATIYVFRLRLKTRMNLHISVFLHVDVKN